jgi:GNAT superfamily N-acetyltransferase
VDPLDNPVWHALHGPHTAFAIDGGRACRYEPDVSPFAAVPDVPDDGDWDALQPLVGSTGAVVVRRDGVGRHVDGARSFELACLQMTATERLDARDPPGGITVSELGAADVAEMVELIELTRPGPFRPRTVELGRYLGARDEGGTLVAIGGERMHLPGATEISAVCTHPDQRGRGLAELLVRAVAAGIDDRGERPILHVATDNHGAIRLYERLGFEVRAELRVCGIPGDGPVTVTLQPSDSHAASGADVP